MGDTTQIAWCDHTFNPWVGCRRVSEGCTHCYAEELVKTRMKWDVWANSPRRRTSKANWAKPYRWNLEARRDGVRRRIFCASLADVFEDRRGPNEWRSELFDVIRDCKSVDWLILTKRPENIARMLPDDWDAWPNVWLGTSIEDNRVAHRAADLTAISSVVHFVSYEPAIGPLDTLSLDDIEWMIVGGESGPDYRPMKLEWARDMRRRCEEAGVAFFFKQNHGRRTEMGIDALGEVVRNYPTVDIP